MYRIDIGEFDGNSWEAIMQRCFMDKHEKEQYQRMPAGTNGDNGIEGLTLTTGIVFQCYCPESQYETQELTDKQRDKITKDLKKLVTYKAELMKVLGNQKIKEWHFVTPEIKDKRLVAHCRTKELEYRNMGLEHLADDFTVLIKEHINYSVELCRYMQLMKYKIDISVDTPKMIEWDKCDSEHIKNLRRKLKSLISGQTLTDDEANEKIDKLTENFVYFYQRGIKVMNKLETSFPEQYSRLMRVKQAQGEKIENDCLLSTLQKHELFNKIQSELIVAISESLGSDFEKPGVEQLAHRITAEWLMLCPLDFGG